MVRWTKEKEWHQIHFILYSLFWWMRAYVHFFQAQDCENVRFFFMNDNYVHHLIRVRNRVSSTFHTLWCKNHNALHLYYISRSSCCHSTFALDMHQIMLFVITISSPPSTASNSVWCNGVCTECILPDLSAKCARYSKQKLANKYDNITEKLFAELWQASWNYSLIQYTYKTRSNWKSTLLLFRYLSHNDCYNSKKQQKCICSHDWHVHTHTPIESDQCATMWLLIVIETYLSIYCIAMSLTSEYALLQRPYDTLIAPIIHDKNQHLFWQQCGNCCCAAPISF